ncbi:membrane protein insertase YidC [Actinotalea subterranea]|uniref:membrane protein insertase YidC n=1 Tax=Actinotalea subterranea TaxID=2607497 RepID=UPI0011EEF4EF
MNWFDTILWPLKVAVAWIMVQFHTLLTTLGLPSASGVTWALSIVGLVIVIRIALIPLFVRQIKAQRGMQLLSPELQAIQKKYKGKTDPASREAMSRETMELYRKHGTNPFSSCLPILAQSPIFFALFRVLYSLGDLAEGNYPVGSDNPKSSIGPLTQQLAAEANNATIFDAPISSYFLAPDASAATRIVTVALIVAMSVTTFTTQRQLTQKNMPASALQGPMAQQQKMLLYILPLVFAISGVNFPIGVLIYWTTTNLWTMGQQFYVIRRNPTPGSEAERLLKERRAKKAAARGIVLEEEKPAIEEKPRGQRQQPKRKDRVRPAEIAGTAAAAGTGAAKAPGAKPAGAKPAGAKPAGAKPAGAKPAGAKPAGAKPAGAKPAGSTAAGATTGGTKPAGATPGRATSAGGKPARAKSSAARPETSGSTSPGLEGSVAEGGNVTDGASGPRPARAKAPRKAASKPEPGSTASGDTDGTQGPESPSAPSS